MEAALKVGMAALEAGTRVLAEQQRAVPRTPLPTSRNTIATQARQRAAHSAATQVASDRRPPRFKSLRSHRY